MAVSNTDAKEEMKKILVESFNDKTEEEINALIEFICIWSNLLVKQYIKSMQSKPLS